MTLLTWSATGMLLFAATAIGSWTVSSWVDSNAWCAAGARRHQFIMLPSWEALRSASCAGQREFRVGGKWWWPDSRSTARQRASNGVSSSFLRTGRAKRCYPAES